MSKLRLGQSDIEALKGAYVGWLQYMADGAYAMGSQRMCFPEGTVARERWERSEYRYATCGAFIAEARHRGWVEQVGKNFHISQRGREALEEFRASGAGKRNEPHRIAAPDEPTNQN